ncbi:MAG: DUF732 domain-containing protein [Mycobacterium sp.]
MKLTAAALLMTAAGALTSMALAPAAQADQLGYLINVTVRPVYHFANADAALGYGYSMCDRLAAGEGYPQLAESIRNDFNTRDEFSVSYLLSQSTQELCPAQIWQLRQTAGGYRAPA